MQCLEVEVNVIGFNSVLSACEKCSEWQDAMELLTQAPQRGLVPDGITYNAVLSACDKGKQWQLALHILKLLEECQLQADDISCNAAISACAKGDQWQRALVLFMDFEFLASSKRDLITYNAAMNAMARGGQWLLALAFLARMHHEMLEPDQISFNAALDACCKGQAMVNSAAGGGGWRSASHLLTLLYAGGFQGSIITVNTAMLVCMKAQQWQLVLRLAFSSRGSSCNAISRAVLCNACWIAGQMQLLCQVLPHLDEDGLQATAVV